MIPSLRPFQFEVVDGVRASAGRGNRIIVIQSPTGSGKTTISCHITKLAVAKGRAVLFLVHRRKLVDQISERLEAFEINHGVIMNGEKLYSKASVQVASRDTLLSRCFRHEWTGLPPADLIIVDEAHHAADPGSEYRRILENYPKATILLVTATPVGPDGQGLGPWAQDMVCAIPTTELVKQGFLVPVKCYAPDRKMHKGKARRGIAGDLVESWKQFAENRPTVLFCSRVQHSLDAVEAFKQEGIKAVHVDAETPDYAREAAFAGLVTGEVKIVSNVGIIGEGVDVPELGCCQLYCECNGRVGFIQRCGRIMRPSEGKEYGILIDHAGAVFRHGFPDEDTTWTLEGDADAEFKKKHDEGKTEPVHYCKACETLFKTPSCPMCGKLPSKPPRSIFAPPPIEASGEVLTEADRRNVMQMNSHDEKVKHYIRCLGVAAQRNGTFGMAASIYKTKYSEWPGDNFPCVPERGGWKTKILDVYPNFKRKPKSNTSKSA